MFKTFCFLFGLLFLSLYCVSTVDADLVVDTSWVFDVGNQNYTISSGTLNFDKIMVNSSWIVFNSTGFNISSTDGINISLISLSDNIVGASVDDKVLSFNADTSAGTVWFDIDGFEQGQSYDVFRDSVLLLSTTSSVGGVVNFSSSVWSSHQFDIYEDEQYAQIQYTWSDLEDISTGWDNTLNVFQVVIIISLLAMAVGAIILYTKTRR